ncbi:carboxymuconolactone decarboxylase family protein [Dyadobacter flavalbus]|uniref:Carboxymuconolactone decarboxylase family protein n=1 Tax=Dyadobacter flavalbus TaxID=2579942 RepID=A0A5M8QX86_9BACT|nr:carboxymuconolactone decarboxylase family protein [Dyadobacter flavalbus]KAA6440887.1 carboxymuconolactone decarboxylase family protein [Dyadobacter flavalbus]
MKQLVILFIATFTISNLGYAQGKADLSQELDSKQKSLIEIAALTANGDLADLRSALNGALVAGLSINEIKEEFIHVSAYCGFPRALNGIITFNSVLDERKAKKINDPAGKAPTKPTESNKYESGKKVLESLTGQPDRYPKTGYAAFVPGIDTLLKEHLFNDIFTRGVLDYKQRELITVSILATLGGVESQLSGHIGISLHLGISKKQLQDLLNIIADKVGDQRAVEANKILERVSTGANR